MTLGRTLRRRWPEALLIMALTLPWLALLALGMLWLWQRGHVWAWAIAAAALALLAWPLARLARRRTNAEARVALGDRAEPARAWNVREREAWSDVLAIADAAAPFSLTEIMEIESLRATASRVIEAVAARLHPEAQTPWAQFTAPELLLLTERVSRDLRREALRTIPGIRVMKLGHVLWLQEKVERYGPMWTVGYNLWRVVRLWNPAAAMGREISRVFDDKFATVLWDRLRARVTQQFVLEVGRAAIDLYSGRLALSEEELRLAQERDGRPPPSRLRRCGSSWWVRSMRVNRASSTRWRRRRGARSGRCRPPRAWRNTSLSWKDVRPCRSSTCRAWTTALRRSYGRRPNGRSRPLGCLRHATGAQRRPPGAR